jgi:hypothetical protein
MADAWYKETNAVQLDAIINQKCRVGGAWHDHDLCACFQSVGNTFPGYNPVCHNSKCLDLTALRTREVERASGNCAPLTICQTNLSVEAQTANLNKIKFTNDCGDAEAPPVIPRNATRVDEALPQVDQEDAPAPRDNDHDGDLDVTPESVAVPATNAAATVGIAVGVGVGAVLIVGLVIMVRRRKQKK